MTIYICDDEPVILNFITKKISEYMSGHDIHSFPSGHALLKQMEQMDCDILFLDIDMPDFSGMDTAEHLNGLEKKPLLIFVTNHDELVYESLQYHPFGFIRKSYFNEEIQKVLKDCEKELQAEQRHFHFRSASKEVALLLSDILYFEADGNYLLVYTGEEKYRFRSTVSAVENSLRGCGFIRVHKGFLVNQSAVKLLGREELELNNGTRIPMGKSYGDGAKKQLLKYMRM